VRLPFISFPFMRSVPPAAASWEGRQHSAASLQFAVVRRSALSRNERTLTMLSPQRINRAEPTPHTLPFARWRRYYHGRKTYRYSGLHEGRRITVIVADEGSQLVIITTY